MAGTGTTKAKDTASDAPTEAQLATIATLCDALGVEPPEPVTTDAAAKVIETLQAAYEERDGDPELVADPGAGADDDPADPADDPAATPADPGLSVEQTQKLFDQAVTDFGSALSTVFDVEQLEPSQTPGVVGFLLPGFSEQLPHPDFTRCTTCNGYGNVLTGSIKAGDTERPCPDQRCKGRGFWQKAGPPESVQATLVAVPQVVENGAGEWGEAPKWMGNPALSGGGA